MNYIVIDFEWNQSMSRQIAKKRFPFEIVEIGAVKLDENYQEIDSFSQVIKPRVYKKVHYMTKELTGLTERILSGGMSFHEAAVDFLLWCGDDYMFVTWGNTDMVEFQRNLSYYHLLDLLPGPIRYINAQKIFRLFYSDLSVNSSLETAVNYFNLEHQNDFHRALTDARYTAEVLGRMDRQKVHENYTIDYYQYPQKKKDEIHLTYDGYYKFISRGFDTKEEALNYKELKTTRCYICGRTAPKRLRWFVSKTKTYYCIAECREHGLIRGKIKFKRMDDGKYVAVKTLRLIDEDVAADIRRMKEETKEKRREKRHKGNDEGYEKSEVYH